MSHIFLEKDNITILGDVYEYDIHKSLTEFVKQKAIMIQIILVVNGKQKIFRTNFDLEGYSKTSSDGKCGEVSGSLKLKDYSSWYVLRDFLLTIGYDIGGLNIANEIEKAQEEKLPYETIL